MILLWLPVALMAQSSGKIKGLVKDKETGEMLPGVNVVLDGTNRGAVTDGDGYYVIMNVPVGSYSVIVTLMGYQKVSMENIRVSAGVTTDVNFSLEQTTLEVMDAVVIRAERPLVEKNMTQSFSKVNSEELSNIPVRGIQQILSVQSSVNVQDNNVYIRGGRSQEVGYYLDGASAVNPLNNTNAVYVIQDAVEEVQVLAGGYTAEYGGANSGIVKTELKTGGADYKATFDFQTDKFAGEGKKFLNTYAYQDHILSASFSGPLLSKNVRFFVALENAFTGDAMKRFSEGFSFQNLVDGNPANTKVSSGHPDTVDLEYPDGFTPRNETNQLALNSTLLFDFKPVRFRLSAVYSWFKQYGKTDGGLDDTPMLDILNTRKQYILFNTLLLSGSATHVLSPTTYYDVKLSFYNRESETNDDWFGTDWKKWADANYVNPKIDSADYMLSRWVFQENYLVNGIPFTRDGSLMNYRDGTRSYTQTNQSYLSGSINFVSQLTNVHELKIGLDYKYYTLRRFNINPRVMSVLNQYAPEEWLTEDPESGIAPIDTMAISSFDAVISDSIPRDVWRRWNGVIYGYDPYGNELDEGFDGAKHPTFGSFYVQDKAEYKFLIINAGFRVDYFDTDDWTLLNPTNPANIDKVNKVIPESEWKQVDPFIKVSPRLGFSFPVSDKTVFYMQYGKFWQTAELNDIYYDSFSLYDQIAGGLFYSAPIGFGLEPISSTQYEIGFRQQLSSVAAFDLSGFYKNVKGQTMVEKVTPEPGAIISAYNRLINGDFATTKGLELKFTLRRTNRLQAQLNYTLTRAEGTGSSENAYVAAAERATQKPTILSPLDFSQTHRGALILDYRFDKGDGGPILEQMGLNLLMSFNSGHPYTYVYYPPGGQVTAYEAAVDYMNDTRNRYALEPLNTSITPWNFNVDFRLDKSFNVGKFDIGIFLRVTNLFNTKNVINVYQATGSASDDGYLGNPTYSGGFISAYGGQDYIDLYRAINVKNSQAYLSEIDQELYCSPRQIFVGMHFSY